MNNRDTGFQDLESAINSNNMSSGQLVELEHISPRRLDQNPSLNLSQLPQLDTMRNKRDIFDKTHYKQLSVAHKTEVQEDDCYMSVQSGRSEPQVSISSISHKRIVPIRLGSNQQIKERSSKTINHLRSEQDDALISGVGMLTPLYHSTTKVNARIQKYQTIVQEINEQQQELEKKQNEEQKQFVREQTKQTSLLKHSKSKEPGNKPPQGLNEVWSVKALTIIRLVSRFIQQLKQKTERIKFRLINNRIFNIIGDTSADYDYILLSKWIKQKPSMCLKLQHTMKQQAQTLLNAFSWLDQIFTKNIKVIRPDSLFKIFWDVLLLLFILLNIFYIPMDISFEINTSEAFQWLFDLLPSWIFIAEIVLNFNTAYYDKGLMHEDRKQIIKHYVKGNLVWDLIVVIPFLMSYLNIPFVKYTLLIRVTRIAPLMTSIEDVLNLEERIQVIVDLFKLVFFILLTGHFCGCAWHFLAVIETTNYGAETTWLTVVPGMSTYSWFDRYILSVYWSTITTVTVGYGDIVPQTTAERIFVIIVTFIVCGVFGYCLSDIGNIFKQISDKKAVQKVKLKIINQHIKNRGLNYTLQLKVRKYFEYFFRLEQEENSHGDQFMTQLTKHLKEEVMTDLYSKNFRQSRFLRENFNEQTINGFCLYAKEKKLLPEDLLFQKNDEPVRLWFLLSGGLEYFADHQNSDDQYESMETHLRKITTGAVVGEQEFITQTAYNYSARAIKFTQLLYINYEDFIKVLKENENQFERFCLIKDNLQFNSNYKTFGQICEICKWTHSFIQCPFVFLQPNKNKIANNFSQSKHNNRLAFPYRSLPKSNFRMVVTELQEAALGFIAINNILSEKELTDNYLVQLGFQLNDDYAQNRKVNFKSQTTLTDGAAEKQDKIPTMQPSIQAMVMDSRLQGSPQTQAQQRDGSRQANSSIDQKDSVMDWDQQSQVRSKSLSKVKLESFNRGKTIQSIKSKYQGGGGDMLDESVIQEELKPQSFAHNSFNQIQSKLKMSMKAKGNTNLRKISWRQDSTTNNNNNNNNVVNHRDSSDSSEMKLNTQKHRLSRQASKIIDNGQHDNPITYDNDVRIRMESRHNSILSKKAIGEFAKRKKKKQDSQLMMNLSMNSVDGPDTRSLKQQLSSSLFTNGMQQSMRYIDDKQKQEQKQEQQSQHYQQQQQDNGSLIVAHSEQQLQKRIHDIVHTHVEMDIDAGRSSLIYFPNFNMEEVINRLNKYYDELNQVQLDEDMKQMRRTKTNMTLFDRIRQGRQTINRTYHEKSFQQD